MAHPISETDGSMILIVTRDPTYDGDRRKTPALGWKEASAGLVYAEGNVDPIFRASTREVNPAGDQLGLCTARTDLGADMQVCAVGEGAPRTVDQTDRVFGAQSNSLVDFYHLCEYLAVASKGCTADYRAWCKYRKRQMKSGQDARSARNPRQR